MHSSLYDLGLLYVGLPIVLFVIVFVIFVRFGAITTSAIKRPWERVFWTTVSLIIFASVFAAIYFLKMN